MRQLAEVAADGGMCRSADQRRRLISLACRLSTALGQRGCWVTHTTSLDLVAGMRGFSSWYQLNSLPGWPRDLGSNELDLARLLRRVRQITGIHIDRTALSVSRVPQPEHAPPVAQAGIWRAGPPAGIYVTTSWAAASSAVARYVRDTGADCQADNLQITQVQGGQGPARDGRARATNLVYLGPSRSWPERTGIFTTRLHRAPAGTLIVMGPVNLTQRRWSAEAEKLHEACRWVLERGHRVIVVVQTPRPDVARGDLVLALRTGDYDVDYLEQAFRGMLNEDGHFVSLTPFAEARSGPAAVTVPRIDRELPGELRAVLDAGLRRRSRGFLIVGGERSSAEREILFKLALKATESAGPVALVLPTYDHDIEEDWEPLGSDTRQSTIRSRRFPTLPLFPSVESARASGYRRIACWGDCGQCDLSSYADEICFVTSVASVEVNEALVLGAGASVSGAARSCRRRSGEVLEPNAAARDPRDSIIAVLCWSIVYGRQGTCPLYDAFVPAPQVARWSPAAEVPLIRRQLCWEQQLRSLLTTGQLTSEDIRTHLLELELIAYDDHDEWEQVATEKGLRAWLARHMKQAPRKLCSNDVP